MEYHSNGLTRKYNIRLKKLLKKDTLAVSGEEKSFITSTPGACVIKLITAVIYLDSVVKP